MIRCHFLVFFFMEGTGLKPKSGMAEVSREGLAFPKRSSRKPFGDEDV